MTSRSQIWDGAQWIDLTSGVDTALLDATYLRLDESNNSVYLPFTGGTLTGALTLDDALLNMNRTGVGFINMIRTDGAITDGRGQTNLRVSLTQGFVIRTGSSDNLTVPLQDRFLLDFEFAQFNVPLRIEDGSINDDQPGLEFKSNPGTGLYHESAFNDIRFMVGGETVAVLNDVVFQLIAPVQFNMAPDTTAASPDVVWRLVFGDVLELVRDTSSARYKTNIAPAPDIADLVLNPVRFYHPGDDHNYIGFIAEDVEAQDVDAVTYMDDEDGNPRVENYDLRAVVAILAAKVNRLEGA